MMIDHISIGVRDIERSRRFYDAALKPLGYTLLKDVSGSLGYGQDTPRYWVSAAERPVPPDMESGLHICFAAPDTESVQTFYTAALAAGGQDNGKPGLREVYAPDYYAAFVIDPDGYRIEAYCQK